MKAEIIHVTSRNRLCIVEREVSVAEPTRKSNNDA